jgi:hypothetical protein
MPILELLAARRLGLQQPVRRYPEVRRCAEAVLRQPLIGRCLDQIPRLLIELYRRRESTLKDIAGPHRACRHDPAEAALLGDELFRRHKRMYAEQRAD